MRRYRVLRILLPLVVVAFLAVLFWSVRPRPPRAPTSPEQEPPPQGTRAEKIEITDLEGADRRGAIRAGLFEPDGAGGYRLRDVERLVVERLDAAPLLLSAASGAISAGRSGERVVRLEGGVAIRDEETGLRVSLPTVEINESAGVARSLGEVTIESADLNGRAASVTYSLSGEPTEFLTLRLETADGATLEAPRAILPRRSRTIDLLGGIRVHHGGWTLIGPTARVDRDLEGRVERVVASGGVTVESSGEGAPTGTARAERVEAAWSDDGRPGAILLYGQASIEQAEMRLEADTIESDRRDDLAGAWEVRARGLVRASGVVPAGPSRLSAETLDATVLAGGEIGDAVATGRVRVESPTGSAEAARATFRPTGSGLLRLEAVPGAPARLVRGPTRLAARWIETDPAGDRIRARGEVEAVVLPEGGDGGGTSHGLFRAREAVHFVAQSFESRAAGRQLSFEGNVRAWQGERYLAGDLVTVRQDRDDLSAIGGVRTRIPTATETGVATAYVQVDAERLDYRGLDGRAEYAGDVRVRQGEGWMEASRLEVDLPRDGDAAREMRAFDDVRFEFRAPSDRGLPEPVRGLCDRLVHRPAENLVLLYGDRRPATVRREGASGGTTSGRVLRYRLDTGRTEVESGASDRARIETQAKP